LLREERYSFAVHFLRRKRHLGVGQDLVELGLDRFRVAARPPSTRVFSEAVPAMSYWSSVSNIRQMPTRGP
jgi:hypothetical protein